MPFGKLILLLITTGFCLCSYAQVQPPEADKSPLDVSYAPFNFPVQRLQGKQSAAQPLARVIYSRPQKNGRQLFGAEIAYDQIWRLGANETTEIEFFRNVNFAGKPIPKGRYSLLCIPGQEKWTIILNKDLFTWGAFNYSKTNDIARITVNVARIPAQNAEYFTMFFNENNHLVIMWSDVRVVVPIIFSAGR